jgi:hypothetical protein
MSRTIRKRKTRLTSGQRCYADFICGWWSGSNTLNRDKSMKREYKQMCFNNTHRTRRSVEREQTNIVYKLDNYEDIWFNDSRAEMKRRSVWWEIY